MTIPTTFAAMLTSDRDNVVLDLTMCGVAITQYPQGNTGSPATVTAIIGKGIGHDDRVRGKDNIQNSDIWVSTAAVTVDALDQWLIQGSLWQTVAWSTDVGGLTHVTLKAMQSTLRTGIDSVIGGIR